MKKTNIKGKESALETTIEKMERLLKGHGFDIVDKSWLNPAPGIHSLHIHEATCPLLFTNGKGAVPKACRASALGEFFERLGCNYLFADYCFSKEISTAPFVHHPEERWFLTDEQRPEGLLNETLWDFYDPDGTLFAEDLFDINTGVSERGICALPFVRRSDGEKVYFPVNIVGNLYVSNGMAAGNSAQEARVQALSEILERHIKARIIKEGLCLPEIPEETIARYPAIEVSIDAIRSQGVGLKVCDASLGGKYPVVNITMIDPHHGTCLASFGAHPSFEVALERTLTELLQGRAIDRREDFLSPVFEEAEFVSDENIVDHFINATGTLSCDFFRRDADFDYTPWDFNGDTNAQFAYLVETIESEGYEIYIADYDHLGIDVCRIIVPGMSEIYPVSDLTWNNNNVGARYRPHLLSLDPIDRNGWMEILENLEVDEVDENRKVAEFIGIAPDPGTAWERLQIGTLKAMLALAAGESEIALEYVRWVLHFADLDDGERRLYRCIDTLLTIEMDQERERESYEKGLRALYTNETYELACAIVDGNIRFPGLLFSGNSLRGFDLHQKLLANLHKCRAAMQKECR